MEVLLADNGRGEGDWKGIYIDGKLIYEGHSLELWKVLICLRDRNQSFKSLDRVSVNDEQMDIWGGSFPANLDDLYQTLRPSGRH